MGLLPRLRLRKKRRLSYPKGSRQFAQVGGRLGFLSFTITFLFFYYFLFFLFSICLLVWILWLDDVPRPRMEGQKVSKQVHTVWLALGRYRLLQ